MTGPRGSGHASAYGESRATYRASRSQAAGSGRQEQKTPPNVLPHKRLPPVSTLATRRERCHEPGRTRGRVTISATWGVTIVGVPATNLAGLSKSMRLSKALAWLIAVVPSPRKGETKEPPEPERSFGGWQEAPHSSAAPPSLDDPAHLGAQARDDVGFGGEPVRRLGRVGDQVVELSRRVVRAGLDPRRLGEAA